ncbi:MAG: Uma2 family endonuclease [Tildeniella nuda ZEHNDER 1965/U140]|jgi:Uma2 family endonuclease|nr:Uma2 family endonuclease [Tildeniella nuda ZEHNDER 1965/U140]
MSLTIKDLEKLQAQAPDYRMELVNGSITVMSPSGYESDEVAFEVGRQISNWVRPRKLGRVTGSSAGFTLPNSDTRAPDVSFVQAQRLRTSPRSFAELAPDLMVEVKSPTDSLKGLREKIDSFLAQGTRVGILIHPEQRWVEIRRTEQEPMTLRDGDALTVPDILPGWQVKIEDLWSPQFDELEDEK